VPGVPKRFHVAVVALPLLIAVTATASPISSPDAGGGPCALTRRTGEPMTHLTRRRITCAVDRFGPVGGGAARAICIAKRESGLDPTAESATGKYLGLYQHSAKMWPDRYDRWTRKVWSLSHRALNGRSNSIVTIRMVHALGGWKVAGWPVDRC
jgi:hypothetical protein